MLQYLDTIIALAVVMLGLSLVITLLNQMVSSFLSFRGSNLRWGIGTMLSTLAPNLNAEHVDEIANKILTEQIVSDSIFAKADVNWLNVRPLRPLYQLVVRWKLASAIGPDTLVRVLTNLSEYDLPYAPDLKKLLAEVDPAAVRKLSMAYAAFGTPPAGSASDHPASPIASPLDPTAPVTLPNYAVQMNDLLAQLGNSAQQSVGKIEAWFNVAMNRVSQRFAMKVRILTVIFAFLLAFGLHLDSLQMTNQFFKNPVLRQKFVNQSGAMLNEATAIMGNDPGATTETTTSPKVLKSKMEELRDREVKKDPAYKPDEQLPPVPENFRSIDEAEKWLFTQLKLKDDVGDQKRKSQLEAEYRSMVAKGLGAEAKSVLASLQDAGIEFSPRPLPKWNWLRGWREFFGWKAFFAWDNRKNLAGILLTAALLSLGAPFWYNMLKSLTNLRPLVATKQDEQKKEAAH